MNATNLTVNGPCVNGTTVGATIQSGEVSRNCNGPPAENQSVWYRFTATNNTLFIAFEDGPDCNVNLELFNGSAACPDPGYIGCVDWGTGGGTLLLTGLTVGNTYYIKIQSRNCTSNNFCVGIRERKSNDDPCGATPIPVNGGCVVDSNWYSTSDVGLSVPSCWSGTAPGTVWYSFVATNDSMIISTDFLANYYTGTGYGGSPINAPQIALYSSSNGTCSGTLTEIACNQLGGLYTYGGYLFLTNLTPGTTYFIRLNGAYYDPPFIYTNVLGSYCIQVHEPCRSAIPGETAASANLIDNCGTAFGGSTSGAYHEGLSNTTAYRDLDCDGTAEVNWSVENDTWFYFCVDNSLGTQNWNFTVSVSSCASGCGIQWGVMQGSPSNLNPLYTTTNTANCNTDAINPGETDVRTISINPNLGCVYIVFDGYGGSICNYSISIQCQGCICNILPIEVLTFSARRLGSKIELFWLVSEETGVQSYRVYKSEDGGQTYFLWKEVPVTENRAYRVFDEKPVFGPNYYHLKVVETTGNEVDAMAYTMITYSLQGIEAQYDPVSRTFYIVGENNEFVVFTIYDLNGQKVLEKGLALESGRTKEVDLSDLAPGIYLWHAGGSFGKFVVSSIK